MRALLLAKLNSTDYSPKVRPIKDTGNVLRLEVDMYLVAINNVDEVEQKITSTAYMKIKWSDTFMTWNVSAYGNIAEFTIPQDNIWKPDLALANAFDTVSGLGDKFMYLTISNDGNITWEPYQVFESTCNLDMTYFPFDSQTCDIQLATWSSTRDMIQIVPGSDGFSIESYEGNANWELKSVSTYDSSTATTSSLSFTINIRRKPIFYLINFMIPIALLSFLNTFVFILPCDSGEKTGYAIILFLSFAIFLLIVTEIMPEGMNTIPVISTYLLIECVFSTIIVIITIIQLRLHNQGEDTPVTHFLEVITKLVTGIKRKVCCESASHDDDQSVRQEDASIEGIEEIPLTPMKPRLSKRHVQEERMATERQESPRKRRGIGCCGGDADVEEIELRNGIDSRNTNDQLPNHSASRKTSIRLSDILGNSNKISPNEYFRKPAAVNRIAIEDFEDDDLTGRNRPRSDMSGATQRSWTADQKKKVPPSPEVEAMDQPADDNKTDGVTWPAVGLALDNLFFVIFLIINTLTTIVVFIVCAVN
ncbi:hypothetical protein ACF0H5_008752 [Mactra antiquata]